jgi:DnaJ-class molecular chaperone
MKVRGNRVIARNTTERNELAQEEQCGAQVEAENARRSFADSKALLTDKIGTKPPFVVRTEEKCEDCGGSGYGWGSLSPMEPEECPTCHGSGKQIVVGNYLAEALWIAAGRSARCPEREHLEAIVQHCRALVGAVFAITDIG